MRIDKREMTLNERDSAADMLALEKALLGKYVEALAVAKRKETRGVLVDRMKSLADEVFFLTDILERIEENV